MASSRNFKFLRFFFGGVRHGRQPFLSCTSTGVPITGLAWLNFSSGCRYGVMRAGSQERPIISGELLAALRSVPHHRHYYYLAPLAVARTSLPLLIVLLYYHSLTIVA